MFTSLRYPIDTHSYIVFKFFTIPLNRTDDYLVIYNIVTLLHRHDTFLLKSSLKILL